MFHHSVLKDDRPVVVVCNISETFFEFLNRAPQAEARARLIQGEQYRGDRALLWLGDPKLVLVSFPVPHAEYLCRTLGYPGTQYAAPANPSPWLSLDIMREPALMNRLVEYAGPDRVVQLVPYATTRPFLQLAETLRSDYGLTVLLPESPAPDCLWVRDYIDTKTGFRVLVSRWLPDADTLLPRGVVCQTRTMAAAVVQWFIVNKCRCIVKADLGENGIGNYVWPETWAAPDAILRELQGNPFWQDDWVTVEELIVSPTMLSPSLELFVPPPELGVPFITYLSQQLFMEFGDFCGVLVSRELLEQPWYPRLAESGLRIAARLQALGYVGHFDLDAIVDESDRVFLLEINSRRTGGTHVHELAQHLWGPRYLDEVVLLSHDTMDSGVITDPDKLLETVGDLLYPMPHEQRGVILTVTSSLSAAHEFGCIIVAASVQEAVTLQQTLMARIRRVT